MVEPRITEWFGFYKPGQSSETQTLQESDLYIQVLAELIYFCYTIHFYYTILKWVLTHRKIRVC